MFVYATERARQTDEEGRPKGDQQNVKEGENRITRKALLDHFEGLMTDHKLIETGMIHLIYSSRSENTSSSTPRLDNRELVGMLAERGYPAVRRNTVSESLSGPMSMWRDRDSS